MADAEKIGELYVDLEAKTLEFDAALDKAEKRADNAGEKIAEGLGGGLDGVSDKATAEFAEVEKIADKASQRIRSELEQGEQGVAGYSERANKEFTEIEQRAAKAADKIEGKLRSAGDDGFGAMTKAAAKTLAVMGAVELGVKGIDVVLALAQGDVESAAELVKTLPGGIGAVATAMDGLIDRGGTYLGIWESIDKIVAMEAKATRAATTDIEKRVALAKELRDIQSDAEYAAKTAGMSGDDREMANLERERQKQLDATAEKLKGFGQSDAQIKTSSIMASVNAEYDARRDVIVKRIAEEARLAVDGERDKAEQVAEVIRAGLEAEADAAQAEYDRKAKTRADFKKMVDAQEASLQSDIKIGLMRQGGDDLGADLEEIAERFNKKIAEAPEQLKDELEKLKDIEIDARMKQVDAADTKSTGNAVDQSEFRQVFLDRLGTDSRDPAKDDRRKQNSLLETIAANTGKPVLAVAS